MWIWNGKDDVGMARGSLEVPLTLILPVAIRIGSHDYQIGAVAWLACEVSRIAAERLDDPAVTLHSALTFEPYFDAALAC